MQNTYRLFGLVYLEILPSLYRHYKLVVSLGHELKPLGSELKPLRYEVKLKGSELEE